MGNSGVVGTFLPSRNGFHFANRFPPGPTLRLGPIDPRWFGIGDASDGLCGGMAWYVRERYERGLPIPSDTEPPANGSPLFSALVRRQVRSLDWLRGPLAFWWMGALGTDRAARRTREREWPRIHATIDAGRLAMVGLVRHRGLDPRNLANSHQVLAYEFEIAAPATAVRVYDPNWPDRDDVTITIEPDRISQSTGEPLLGILSL